jgi:hypothetical protein
MAKLAPRPKKSNDVPANAKLDSLEVSVGTRSYEVYGYFEATDSSGIDFYLKVGKGSDLGKALSTLVEAMKRHPKRKVT